MEILRVLIPLSILACIAASSSELDDNFNTSSDIDVLEDSDEYGDEPMTVEEDDSASVDQNSNRTNNSSPTQSDALKVRRSLDNVQQVNTPESGNRRTIRAPLTNKLHSLNVGPGLEKFLEQLVSRVVNTKRQNAPIDLESKLKVLRGLLKPLAKKLPSHLRNFGYRKNANPATLDITPYLTALSNPLGNGRKNDQNYEIIIPMDDYSPPLHDFNIPTFHTLDLLNVKPNNPIHQGTPRHLQRLLSSRDGLNFPNTINLLNMKPVKRMHVENPLGINTLNPLMGKVMELMSTLKNKNAHN